MNHDYNKGSLDLHREFGGKIEIKSKVKLENRDDLSLAYTPGVAEVCREISRDESLAKVYTLKKNTIAIVSDGSAILGIGNLGAKASIPVMEGKAAILKDFAGVDAFPICIESQDIEQIINTIKNISPVFGGINLEDIAGPKCFEIEERLRTELDIPVMHDDQWGAATVALTGFINALKLAEKNKEDVTVVLSGVGAAGVATARLLIEYGVKKIIFVDSKGVINKNRDDLTKEKIELLNAVKAIDDNLTDLASALVGADVFIGLSKPLVVTSDMVKSMNAKPIIFALANPTPEIMPEDALTAGAFIVATGRSDYPNQLNNSLVFPGFWRGMLDAQNNDTYKGIDNKIFVKIAENLATHVTDLSVEKILPDMFDKEVSNIVAKTVTD
jgi:malate dehydrogenase (oxaloacetate-decarboxylating)